MILALLWPLILIAIVVLAIPFVVLVAPAIYAARCTATAGHDNKTVFGAFATTLIYSWFVWEHVTGTAVLLLLLVAVPWLLGRVVAL